MSQYGAFAILKVVSILEIISSVMTIYISTYLRDKRSFIFTLLSLAAILHSFLIAYLQPVSDWYYCAAAVLSLIAAILMCIDLMIKFNHATTSFSSSLYERKGGNDHEKDH